MSKNVTVSTKCLYFMFHTIKYTGAYIGFKKKIEFWEKFILYTTQFKNTIYYHLVKKKQYDKYTNANPIDFNGEFIFKGKETENKKLFGNLWTTLVSIERFLY